MIARRSVVARDSLRFLPPAGRGGFAGDLLVRAGLATGSPSSSALRRSWFVALIFQYGQTPLL